MKPNFTTMNKDFERFKAGEIDSTKLRTPLGKNFATLSLAQIGRLLKASERDAPDSDRTEWLQRVHTAAVRIMAR